MLQHLYLVKIFSQNHFGRGAANSGPGVVGGRAPCRDAGMKDEALGFRMISPKSKTVRVNSLEVTELESCNFNCSFKSLFLQYPW